MAGLRFVSYDPNESTRTKEIPSEVWDSHRDTIIHHWVIEKRTLRYLMDVMRREHEFEARHVTPKERPPIMWSCC
jgi:hypothetical protein